MHFIYFRSPDRRRRRHSSGESHRMRQDSPEIAKGRRNKSPGSRNETARGNKSPARKKPRTSSSADSQEEENVKQV